MRKIWIFAFGGAAYCFLELLWRGSTHWSMALAGGTVLTVLCASSGRMSVLGFMPYSAAVITLTELLFGLVFNVAMGGAVWDYSGIVMNFFGQICLPYSLLWLALSFPLFYIVRVLERKVHRERGASYGALHQCI